MSNAVFQTKPLKQVAHYSKERIDSSLLNKENYVGTDNLLQNKQGKQKSTYVPTDGTVTKYNPNDTLVANIRPYLKKIWFANGSGGASSDVLTFKVKSGYDPRFFYYSVFRDEFFDHMMLGCKGTRMPRGSKIQILEYPVPDIELEEQRRIAKTLSILDSKIDLNNRISRELEAIAKTIYDYWFVQFDFPDVNGRPYKSSGGKMIWSERLKRHIPEGWKVETLGKVCNIYQPQTISDKDCMGNGEYFVHGSNGIIGKYHKFNHEESEIIVSCRGDCGNIHRTLPKMWITGNAMVFQMRDKTIHNEFLYQTLHYLGIKNVLSGSVQGQITRTAVSPLEIIVPKRMIIDKFSDISKDIVSKKLLIQHENLKFGELRDWLLPMLMNGQVRVYH